MNEKSALLVGVNIDKNEYEFNESMNELDKLCETLMIDERYQIIQNRDKFDYKLYVGKGKVQEIKNFCDNHAIDLIVFNGELTGNQLYNLTEELNTKVIDRTTLILDIFSKRAKTKVAKYQIELAQLKYRLPRLKGVGESLSRMGAGIGTRGPGEQKLEIDRRKINRRIHDIEQKLESIRNTRTIQRKRRLNSKIPIVSMVGYSNVGKSTLINKIIDQSKNKKSRKVYTDDLLFATLDTYSRKIVLDNNKEFILNDTVGFVSELPTFLIEAFKATLEEINVSDLILHIVDLSSENYKKEIEVTEKILKELNCIDIPRLIVNNKIDKFDELFENKDQEIFISAKENINIEILLEKISKIIFSSYEQVKVVIPFTENDLSSYLLDHYEPITMEYIDEGLFLELVVNQKDYLKINKYVVGDDNGKL